MTDRPSANPTPAKASPVIIIGAHRSGTTATTRALELLGLQIGQRLDSHRESKRLQQMHEQYLQTHSAAWHHPDHFLNGLEKSGGEQDCADYLRAQLQKQFFDIFGYRHNLAGWWQRARLKRGAAWGWKEPRTTLFAPGWLQIFPEARFIDVVRHPLAVALSIREREQRFRDAGDAPIPGLDRIDYCLKVALTYVEAGERLAARTRQYRRVRFEAMQADAGHTLQGLAAFCGLQPNAAQLLSAVQSIRPPSTPLWPDLTTEEHARLMTHADAVAKRGYDLPRPGKTME